MHTHPIHFILFIYSTAIMLTIPHFVYLSKIFCLNSAHNPAFYNKWLLVYNVLIVATYIAFLVFRASEPTYEIAEVNQIVIHLQLVAYVTIFAANITSNWTKSKTFYQSLLEIDAFDENTKFKSSKKPEKWFWLALVFLGYVIGTDLAVSLFVEESGNFYHWIVIFGPLAMNYASCVCAMASLELIFKRFTLLETTLGRMLVTEATASGNVRRFAKLFTDMTATAEAIFGCFSLQIGITCVLVVITATNNIYLCLQVTDYTPLEYLAAVNLIVVHVVEIGGVVYACHMTKTKSDCVVAKTTELLLTSPNDAHILQVTAGVAAIKANRINNVIYGIVTLNPSTLLGMATTIATYLVIMLQFTSPTSNSTSVNTRRSAGRFGDSFNYQPVNY